MKFTCGIYEDHSGRKDLNNMRVKVIQRGGSDLKIQKIVVAKNTPIGVVGGGGKMGSFLLKTLDHLKFSNLYASDINPKGLEKLKSEIPVNITDTPTLAKNCEVLVVSVPIDATVPLIRDIGNKINPGTLFTHLTSIQSPANQAMTETSPAEVAGIHIMTAPSPNVSSLFKGVNVIVTPERVEKWLPWVYSLFAETNATVCEMSAETHDRGSAIVQAMIHLQLLAAGYTLRMARKHYDMDMKTMELLETPLFRMTKLFLGRIISTGQPDLYSSIQMFNPEVPQIFEWYEDAVGTFLNIAFEKDPAAFASLFGSTARYFGKFRASWAKEDTDAINGVMASTENTMQRLAKQKDEIRMVYQEQIMTLMEAAGIMEIIDEEKPALVHPRKVKIKDALLRLAFYVSKDDVEGEKEWAINLLRAVKDVDADHLKVKDLKSQILDAISNFIARCKEYEAMEKEVLGKFTAD